jgi:hypothetical protein
MFSRRSVLAFATAGLVVAVACNNNLGLPPATIRNVTDTVTLYAVNGTPLSTPSGYAIIGANVVNTAQSSAFDFAYNIDSIGRPVFVPTGALRFVSSDTVNQPGFQYATTTFDNTTMAPTDGYEIDQPFLVDSNRVTIARSRAEICPDGTSASLYAKIAVLSINPVARTVTFQVLTDQNCGYRGLQPGLPQE